MSSVFLLTSLIGCTNEEVNGEHVYQMGISSNEDPSPEDLDSLIEESEVIVKGSFGELVEKTNLIRDAHDITQPSETFHIEGHVYEFFVEENYSGNPDEEIYVVLTYGERITVLDEDENEVGEVIIPPTGYAEPVKSSEYILFLRENNLGENEDESVNFISDIMEGQLTDNVNEEAGTIIHSIREEVAVDVTEEISILNNYLTEEHIEDLDDLEVILNNS
ncbi:hypothetical protein [Evansella clarkii]|uniref:hypothetical protein n=1 Tax=Evansella clarkii TaxID=79879 RepID=UPI000B44B110|nr:hypothetical protein [Evansella clarkii]